MTATELTVDDFDYPLPPELIAQSPLARRTDSRLLRVQGLSLSDHTIADLPSLLSPGDLLVFNDTRVVHARLLGRKASGGQVEVLVERPLADREVLAQVRASKTPRPGSRLLLEEAFEAEVLGREGEFFRLRFPGEPLALLEVHGRLPLPPYITHAGTAEDEARYQTVFAQNMGSVAAPTAGLHFDAALLETLARQGVATARVTLHVGAGTFQPVRVHRLAEHRMHLERYDVPEATVAAIAACRERGGKVVAVGTTTLRTLESAALGGQLQAGAGETTLFVTPGFEFRVVDRLLTNFHLPRSTLLMLVSAFAGVDSIRAAYAHAIECRYRFFSYGDAMLLDRTDHEV